jgi:translation initiation factor IF-3
MPLAQALDLARQRELDLVEVSGNADPPVCRILDYGKLRYLHAKKVRESKKSQKSNIMREVRFRPNIGAHDLEAKTRKVKKLLGDGTKVRVAVFFRGREVTHPELGMALLRRVADELKEEAKLERPPTMEGRALAIILTPNAGVKPGRKPAEVKNA